MSYTEIYKHVAAFLIEKGFKIDNSAKVSQLAKAICTLTNTHCQKFKGSQASRYYNNIIKTFYDNKFESLKVFIPENAKHTESLYTRKANNFYFSKEWRNLRYIILREQGGRCQLCGRSAKDGVILHCDHIIPLSKDWSKRLDKDNVQVLCADCNLGKSNRDRIDWRGN